MAGRVTAMNMLSVPLWSGSSARSFASPSSVTTFSWFFTTR